ncbi:MAG TPA: Rnase Y domain-containing protein, partial [Candidatus Pacearchaeota archaeon]|nr:Rnase Y domain-containing protein [Candidatus Pacearchaeota archaeon]
MDSLNIIFIVMAFLGLSGGYVFYSKKNKKEETPKAVENSQTESAPKKFHETRVDVENDPVVMEAKAKSRELIVEAKAEALNIQTKAQDQARKIREDALETERKSMVLKAQVDAKARELESKAKSLVSIKENLEKKQEEIENFHKKQQEEIEKIASLSKEEARELLLKNLDKTLIEEKGKRIREKEEEIRKESQELSKQILMEALEFGSTDIVIEHSTSKIKLPDEDIKGRIIGKEGR